MRATKFGEFSSGNGFLWQIAGNSLSNAVDATKFVSGRRCPSWSWHERLRQLPRPQDGAGAQTYSRLARARAAVVTRVRAKISSRISPRTLRTVGRRGPSAYRVVEPADYRVAVSSTTGLSADKCISGFPWKRLCRAARLSGRRLLAARWPLLHLMAWAVSRWRRGRCAWRRKAGVRAR